jgi:hypothetical protein
MLRSTLVLPFQEYGKTCGTQGIHIYLQSRGDKQRWLPPTL